MRFILAALPVVLALSSDSVQAQRMSNPAPDRAFLVLATDAWKVWQRQQPIGEGGTSVISYYLQRRGSADADLAYRDTVGQMLSFSPVWVWNNGTVIGWDGFFSFVRDGKFHKVDPEIQRLSGSEYYPVLCGTMAEGIVALTQNQQTSMEANERLYFVPWSFDERVADYDRAQLITDGEGVSFWSPPVRWSGSKVAAWRAPRLFVFDIPKRTVDTLGVNLPGGNAGPLQIAGFDGNRALLRQGSAKAMYDLADRRITPADWPDDLAVIAYHGDYLYGVQGAPLTKSDTLTYLLEARNVVTGQWTRLATLAISEIDQESQLPAHIVRDDRFFVWTAGRWLEFQWIE
jgi:hypothetical protein